MTFGSLGFRKRRHAIVVIICAAMLLSILVSSAYIVHEAACHHSCSGENCPVCQFIMQVELIHRGLGMTLLALLMTWLGVPALREGRARLTALHAPALCTLVGRKIRLND